MSKKKGGNKQKRGKKTRTTERVLDLADGNQVYAEVVALLGNGRVKCFCYDGKERLCKIRGSMIGKIWINQGDVVVIAKRDDEDHKGDLVHKYNADEVRELRRQKAIPSDKDIDGMKNPGKKDGFTGGTSSVFDETVETVVVD